MPRRVALHLLTCILGLVTAVALLLASATLTDGRIDASPDARGAANAALVERFYAAVNLAIGDGDSSALDATVGRHFRGRVRPGEAATGDDLKRYLAGLHRGAPGTRVIVDELTADEDTVAAHVTVRGHLLTDEPPPWGPIDTFRVVDGKIEEHRTSRDGVVLVEPVLRAEVGVLPPDATGVVMARLAYAPGASVAGHHAEGPTLLSLEQGSLALRVNGAVPIRRAGAEPDKPDITPIGFASTLHAGDSVVVPAGIAYGLLNDGADPAIVVGVTVFRGTGAAEHTRPLATPEAAAPLLTAAPGATGAGFAGAAMGVPSSTIPPTLVTVTSGVANGWPIGPAVVAVGRVTLLPGASVAPSEASATLVQVEPGTIGPATAAGDPAPGAGVLDNPGSVPLVLLVLTVSPAGPPTGDSTRS